MKKSNTILSSYILGSEALSLEESIANITTDSRKVRRDTMFFAKQGVGRDGHDFISNAIENGATIIVHDKTKDQKQVKGVVYLQYENGDKALADLLTKFYDDPLKDMKVIGVTGTNGKTTTSYMIYHVLQSLGQKVGLISTIEILIDRKRRSTNHTTPDIETLYSIFDEMHLEGCQFVVMEVSSHALSQRRVEGVNFSYALFSNLSQDHLDYHNTIEEYFQAKKRLFSELCKSSTAIFNNDDKYGKRIVENTLAKKISYGLNNTADVYAKIISKDFLGTEVILNDQSLFLPVVGEFNVYNVLCAYALLRELRFEEHDILLALSQIPQVDGRFNVIKSENGIVGIIDFAHTPDGIINVLKTVNFLNSTNQKIITILGCGGDRDKDKRPKMTQVAIEYSDIVIITSDNPRSEKLQDILSDMKRGLDEALSKKLLEIEDRGAAIKTGIMLAQKGDIVLILGKGHETYQEINGIKYPFDDKKIFISLMAQR